MSAPGRAPRALIFQQRGWGITIGHHLAKRLQAEGFALAAVTAKKSTHRFVVEQREVAYEHVLNHDAIMERPEAVEGAGALSLERVCDGLGIDSVWPLVGRLRNHVRSYGDKYYYAFRQNQPDEAIVAYVKAVYAALKRLLDAFEPDVVLTPNFASMIQDVARLLALRRGVKMVGVFYTKISGRFAFTYSPHVADGPFIERVDALNAGALSPHEAEARAYVEGFCEAFLAPKPAAARPPLRRRLLAEAMPYLLIGRYYQKKLLGKEERRANLGITLDHRPPRIVLRDHYQHKRNRRRALRYPYTPLEGLGPYAYFPLQFQPEAQIDVISPYFSNQIEVARLAAQALPGDLVLAVKEHPSMVGRRGRSYYDKLARSPNVKLIDCRVPSGQVIRGARLVLSPSSTTISEAAFFRVPAIQFGDMGITLKLPNVVKHTDMTTLSARVREALACDLHGEDYDRRLRNYVAAAYDVGFELPYVRMWERGGDEAELEALWRCYREQVDALLGRPAAPRP